MITQDELMTKIVPSIGVVIGTLMFLSPLKAVLDMRRTGRIGVGLMSTNYCAFMTSSSFLLLILFQDCSNRCQQCSYLAETV